MNLNDYLELRNNINFKLIKDILMNNISLLNDNKSISIDNYKLILDIVTNEIARYEYDIKEVNNE